MEDKEEEKMSILIKDMKMPESCEECSFCCYETGLCFALEMVTHEYTFVPYKEKNVRQAWCPLIEIPPHGRLIDADEMLKVINSWNYPSVDELLKFIRKGLSGDAPTVIEAEGRE